ncbi:MAG TPA: hypothetical protein VES67_11700 [Vicinamibacterales bacterium]|nr:hypothetical protein [Vicinamibacterales bacterium]
MKAIGPFEKPIPPETLKKVAAVVPRVEIRDIRLVGLSASLKSAPAPKSQTSVDLDHEVASERAQDGVLFIARVRFKLSASGTGEEAAEFMNLKAAFQLLYSVEGPDSVEDDQLIAFGEINAVHTAWPYFRELVQNISGRMALVPMTVPLLKIGPTAQASHREMQADRTATAKSLQAGRAEAQEGPVGSLPRRKGPSKRRRPAKSRQA